jgi:Domain of unknown function (DUF1835)
MSEADRAARPSSPSPQQHFRLNLEQQKNRAKDLLRAAKAGDARALERMAAQRGSAQPIKLADAQFTIARELRLQSWSRLKEHIQDMERQREQIDQQQPAPDADIRTLHLRCGHDIQNTLKEAGFSGDFLPHVNPYSQGPVTKTADYYEKRARFVYDSFERRYPERGFTLAGLTEGFRRNDEEVLQAANNYERVVIWSEHDNVDQMMLIRVLALYADAHAPRTFEIISLNEFPGSLRFLGLGQLPPEALRLLWPTRRAISAEMLALGRRAWDALRLEDPRPLAAIARLQSAPLTDLPRAVHRHLRELPALENGLSLTEHLVLQALSETESRTLNEIFRLLFIQGREPLFFMGDGALANVIQGMEGVAEPPFVRSVGTPGEREFLNRLTITDAGRAVLAGERDWQSFNPPERWVGGIRIADGKPRWRWDESKREPVEMN